MLDKSRAATVRQQTSISRFAELVAVIDTRTRLK